MKNIVNTFSDVIIIDTTHKSNRFNMPLFDIIVINNFGQTTTCFFALLDDQKFDSFCWALNQFRSQLTQFPNIIFSDEEEALVKGIFIIFFLYKFEKAIEKVFLRSKNYLCSWHVQQNFKKKFAYLNRSVKRIHLRRLHIFKNRG